MNILKFLAFLRGYITYIFQVPVKHYLSTDIVLITQNLRKKIRQGKTYFTGTAILLKKRCTIGVQNEIKTAGSSGSLRVLFEYPSTLRRTSVDSSSGTLRLLFDCASTPTRSAVEALPKPSRRNAKPVSNMSRISLEAEPKASRPGSEVSPSRDFFLTNFALASVFHAIGIKFSSGSHRATPIKTRCRPNENPMKCKNLAGIDQKMVDYSLAQETHKPDYSATLGSPLLSPCYTQGQLNDCTRPTQQKQAFQQVGNARLTYEVESERSVLRLFKSICKAFVFRANTLFGSISVVVQRALKCFLSVADYKRAYRIILICLFLCLVSMFSLSAQTPRKNSGADGLSDLVALKSGDKIPDAVWNQPLELNYFNGKKKTIKFADLKGKLILLDFWSTGCPSCIEGIPDMELIQQRFKDKVQVVMVNSKRNKDTPERIKKRFKKYKEDFNYTPVLPTILNDTLFTSLLPHNTLPTIGIINPEGEFVLNSYASSITEDIIKDFLKTGVSSRFIEKSEIQNTARINTQPLVDTTGLLFCSVMSGYRENYLGVYPAVSYSEGNSLFQVGNYFLNTCYQLAFPDAFKGVQSSLFVFDDRITKEFIDLMYDFKTTKGQFWYQLYLRDSITQELAFDYFRNALIERFHVAVERKKGIVAAYALSLDGARPLWKTKGGMYMNSVDKGNESLIMQNMPLNGVIGFIRSVLDKPVIFEGKSAERIDLRLPGNFLDLSIKQKIAALEQYGITLTPTQYSGEYPYFYTVSTKHTK
ncbi:Thiol-disulfide oxidoreductase resA [Sphingobacterium multivorum]|uniref:TlpA family protein disulfide reductase n=1 Tax=Sphingobacterium multivorum TaxID=28454 RepID=UPI000B48E2DB|nr:TlpA disulfide reductase family protein [Sphingobacterium multivorum]QQT47165.1 TlpA family protein disulfide reductase [Sphingobacterium multivorum]SUJ13761.1 Thiol-disulfide oxidoreductase resA [Sphingobacterium multivorum]